MEWHQRMQMWILWEKVSCFRKKKIGWKHWNINLDRDTRFYSITLGKVGDWKNHFSKEINQIMDDYIESNFKDSDIEFTYEM